MNTQQTLWPKPIVKSDIVFTPVYVSQQILIHLQPYGICLDPCMGDGAFYNYLPIKNNIAK